MPGRFPLTPVPLTNDPFCQDGFCDSDSGGGGGLPATWFSPIIINYSVRLEYGAPSTVFSLTAGRRIEYATQDGTIIRADAITGVAVSATVGDEPGDSATIPYLGTISWTVNANVPPDSGNDLQLQVVADFGYPYKRALFYQVITESGLTLVRGYRCGFIFQPCTLSPFTGQTYGQAVVGYEETVTVNEFNRPSVIINSPGQANMADRRSGQAGLNPPLPRPWFNQYRDQTSGEVVLDIIYSVARTRTVSLIPAAFVRTTLTRLSAHSFKLTMAEQALGGIMVLRYSAPLGSAGFYGPTVVYIAKNEKEAFFTVTPGTYAALGYTVTLERCFGLPIFGAQFWPLEPDLVDFMAYQPPV
jgi:hypothetical protein